MKFKRIVATLLCASIVISSFSYDAFAEEHIHNYEYIDKDNGTHDKNCNCMAEPENEEHIFEEGVCICGAEEPKVIIENEPEPQSDVNEELEHEHEYTYTDKGNGTHDKFCDCMEKPENEAHVFEEGTCVCGVEEKDTNIDAIEGQAESEESEHWLLCEGKKWDENHFSYMHKVTCSVEDCQEHNGYEPCMYFPYGMCICESNEEHKIRYISNNDGTHKMICSVEGCDEHNIEKITCYGRTDSEKCMCGSDNCTDWHIGITFESSMTDYIRSNSIPVGEERECVVNIDDNDLTLCWFNYDSSLISVTELEDRKGIKITGLKSGETTIEYGVAGRPFDSDYGEIRVNVIDDSEIIDEGKCGENASWTICGNTLRISGEGAMYTYDDKNKMAPWTENKGSIDHLVIEEGITDIGEYAFYNMDIVDVLMPEGVKYIYDYAFSNCKLLYSIELPQSLETISRGSFYECKNLRFVYMYTPRYINEAFGRRHHGGIVSGQSLFDPCVIIFNGDKESCSNIESYVFGGINGWRTDESIFLEFGYTKKEFEDWVEISKNNDYELIVPEGCTRIPACAFYNKKISNIDIPQGVEYIGAYAFYDNWPDLWGLWECEARTIYIPETVKYIGNRAFFLDNCDFADLDWISYVNFEGENTYYGFCEGWDDRIGYIKNGVNHDEYDYWMQFSHNIENRDDYPQNKEIKNIEVRDGIKYIPPFAFAGCTNISSIKLPRSVESIEEYAFSGTGGYGSIYIFIPKEVQSFIIDTEWIGGHYGNANNLLCETESLPEGWKKNHQYIGNSILEIKELIWGFPEREFDYWVSQDYKQEVLEIEEGITKIPLYLFDRAVRGNTRHIVVPRSVKDLTGYELCGRDYGYNNFEIEIPCYLGGKTIGDTAAIPWEIYHGTDNVIIVHNYDEKDVTIVKESTHLEEGYGTVYCSDCKDTIRVEIPCKQEHELNYYEYIDEEKHIVRCSCGYSMEEVHEIYPIMEHTPRGHIVYCMCDKPMGVLDHTWKEKTRIVEPSHTMYGESVYSCTVCGYEERRQIDRIPGHKFSDTYQYNADDHWRICPCGEITSVGNHQFLNDWLTISQPTYSSEGTKMKSCECGYKIYQNIPKKNQSDIRIETVPSGEGAPDSSITYMSNSVRDNIYNGLSLKEQAAFEKGNPVKVYSKVNSLTISETGKKALDKAAGNDANVLIYLDISMYVKVGNLNEREIEPGGPVSVKFELPEEYRTNKKRTYKILHLLSDGNVEMLTCYFDANDNTITFTTSSFSEFALAYTEHSEISNMSENPDSTQNPGVEHETTSDSRIIVVSSALPYMTITGLASGRSGDMSVDMKSLITSERDCVNQKIFANYFADQKKLKAKVIDTKDIYAPYTATNEWKKASRIISWKNTGLRPGDMAYAVWYCQEAHDMRFIPAVVSENGTVYFSVPMTGNVSTVSIVKCSL